MRTAGAALRDSTPITELALVLARPATGVLRGEATVVAEMFIPRTEVLRTSILAIWADVLMGLLALQAVSPRVPVTLQLDLDVFQAPTGIDRVIGTSVQLKAGSSVFVAEVDFTDGHGRRFATSVGTFMVAPDPGVRMPDAFDPVGMMSVARGRLTQPFAERAGCERQLPNQASIALREDGRNSSGTLNGGLLALVVEEAALAAVPGTFVESLSMRYLRPVRVGPAVATAEPHGHIAEVIVADLGRDVHPAAVHASARMAPI